MLKRNAGDTLRHARWAKGYSIRKLSDEASVSHTSIVKLEKGDREVSGLTVYAVAKALDIPDPSDLFVEPEEAAS